MPDGHASTSREQEWPVLRNGDQIRFTSDGRRLVKRRRRWYAPIRFWHNFPKHGPRDA